MIRIKAHISLNSKNRIQPFETGYRPIFLFPEGAYTSGSIELLNQKYFYPGDTGSVEILFGERIFLGPFFKVGVKFIFCEGPRFIVGEGIVEEILHED